MLLRTQVPILTQSQQLIRSEKLDAVPLAERLCELVLGDARHSVVAICAEALRWCGRQARPGRSLGRVLTKWTTPESR